MSFSVSVSANLIEMEYAVRGPIPAKAAEMKKAGRQIISCNIGNPQALGQKPISFYRNVLALLEKPELLKREKLLNEYLKSNRVEGLSRFSDEIISYSESYLQKLESGMGAYTESKGLLFVREQVAEFINNRDAQGWKNGFCPADPDRIFLTNGASEGAKNVIEMLITNKNDGIMIPVPQYPLYSATVRRCGGTQVSYYPDEESGWKISADYLNEVYHNAAKAGVSVKAIVVINPGNPTGAVIDVDTIESIIQFASEKQLLIIADEVYQENTYDAEFFSFARVLGNRKQPLVSLHSTSKGFYGECGHRGGYLELRNGPTVEGTNLNFLDILVKMASVNLCSNTVGQVLTGLMVQGPKPDGQEYERFMAEKKAVLTDLHDKASIIKDAFTKMEGVSCFGEIGAMYLFPRLDKLPDGRTDFDYCLALLEKTGLCTVNGGGFGQVEGTAHLRIAFLPPKALLAEVLPNWINFHNEYVCS